MTSPWGSRCTGFGDCSCDICAPPEPHYPLAGEGTVSAADRKCPKCEGADVLIRWHKGVGRYGEGGCGYFAKVVVYGEHLHVTCRTCQYEWAEDCLDALGEPTS